MPNDCSRNWFVHCPRALAHRRSPDNLAVPRSEAQASEREPLRPTRRVAQGDSPADLHTLWSGAQAPERQHRAVLPQVLRALSCAIAQPPRRNPRGNTKNKKTLEFNPGSFLIC